MPAKQNSSLLSSSANHTTSFLVSGFGSGAYSAKWDLFQWSRCRASRLGLPPMNLKFESLTATRSGTQRWSQTSAGPFEKALFSGIFRASDAAGRESHFLRPKSAGNPLSHLGLLELVAV